MSRTNAASAVQHRAVAARSARLVALSDAASRLPLLEIAARPAISHSSLTQIVLGAAALLPWCVMIYLRAGRRAPEPTKSAAASAAARQQLFGIHHIAYYDPTVRANSKHHRET